MTHKVAIMLISDVYDDDYRHIVNSITEWEEISNEDFLVLQSASYRKGFKILEQPTDVKDFIAKTVSEEIVRAKAEAIKLEEDKKKRAAKLMEQRHRKEMKDKESKLALLKKLQAELGEDASKI
jgi:ferritin-like protein